jgi:hypothetical protein
MNRRRVKLRLSLMLALTFLAALACSTRNDSVVREELLQFRSSLQLGWTPEQVEKSFNSANFPRLKMIQERPDSWIVTTPYVFGASNWFLYLTFRDHALVAVKVRTADSAEDHPTEAPPDIVKS